MRFLRPRCPGTALDAVSANISILKSPTVLRLEDGTFYGWEGCHPTAGCCEGSCTHVWNYQQALPFLFPNLERSMRDADYAYNLRPDGGMPFRLQLPIGSAPWEFRPCADGQFGGILKLYRDWKISGDSEWLRNLWSAAKKSLEFAWSPRNIDRWDPDKTGVLWGRQHHTLDMELFGPNSWLTGMYLAALKAGAEIAEHLGETESAAEYRQIFARGKAWADENLFNGEYYYQDIDLGDKSIVDAYADDLVIQGGSAQKAYWTEEHGEIKYQIGAGSSIDQVLGQWHASLYGLGEIFDPEKVKMASAAIFKYNYKPLMRNAYNPDRIYCLNDEGGLVICAWPEGERQPVIPAPYSQETMNGFEYSAATHMIMNGLVEEGMTCVAAVRRRYDGERRNPWNEFECGSNYARSMASYALLNAFSGFQFDMVQRTLSFEPVQAEDGRFRCFWSLDSGWGEFEMGPGMAEVRVLYGDLELNSLRLPFLAGQSVREVRVDERPVKFQQEDGVIRFVDSAVDPAPGQHLAIGNCRRATATQPINLPTESGDRNAPVPALPAVQRLAGRLRFRRCGIVMACHPCQTRCTMIDPQLTGKTVLITGANHGISAATARLPSPHRAQRSLSPTIGSRPRRPKRNWLRRAVSAPAGRAITKPCSSSPPSICSPRSRLRAASPQLRRRTYPTRPTSRCSSTAVRRNWGRSPYSSTTTPTACWKLLTRR